MRILLITDDFLPYSTKISARMMHDLACSLQNCGHKVTVLAPHVQMDESMLIECIDGIETIFFRSGKLKNIGKIKRAINETLMPIKAWSATKDYFLKNHYDLIIYYSPSIFLGGLVRKLKKIWQARSYLVLRDIFPQWAVDNGMIKNNSLIHKYFKYFEKINYQAANKIGVMSNANLQYFQNRNDFKKFEVLYNWIAIASITTVTGEYRKKFNLCNKVILFYGGNIGHAQHMDNIIKMAIYFNEVQNVHFLLVGQGDEVGLVLKARQKNKLNNLTYLPSVGQKEYNEIVKEIDIGLFSLHSDHKTHNFPGKLMGYMEASKPILGVVNAGNDLKDLLVSTNSGFVSTEVDSKFLLDAKSLVDSMELRQRMGVNGRELLKKQFSVENAQRQIIESTIC